MSTGFNPRPFDMSNQRGLGYQDYYHNLTQNNHNQPKKNKNKPNKHNFHDKKDGMYTDAGYSLSLRIDKASGRLKKIFGGYVYEGLVSVHANGGKCYSIKLYYKSSSGFVPLKTKVSSTTSSGRFVVRYEDIPNRQLVIKCVAKMKSSLFGAVKELSSSACMSI